ncbi:hypothetical protein [Agrobacterium tumefaciens]|uniref:hypothetical protein n=1 Tax=Agrobacterium tumefaciens TaxID=358 RepID=UPI0011470A2E
MIVKAANEQIKILRLRRGARYVVALQDNTGRIESSPFWDASHALVSKNIHPSLWNSVTTEVFNEHLSSELPTGSFLFSRRERKGSFRGAVLWQGKMIYPTLFPSIEHAVAAAWRAVSD